MKRTNIIIEIAIVGLILIPTAGADILWGPYITSTTTNSTMINWKTENATTGTVKYATEGYYTEHGDYDHIITDTETKQLHHLAITNQTPNTVYHYQLTVENNSTEDHSFRTFPINESFTFVVYGDTREQTGLFTQMERHKLVADRIAMEENVLFVIHTGDLVCFGNDLDEWNDFFNAGRAMTANTTFYPVLGNHEDNHTNYYEAFGVPEWYSFDCGNAHFTILDSNDWADVTAQTEWLQNDIDSGAAWKFVIFHHPPYSSDERHWGGWINFRDYWEDIFINSSVDAVFNGHVHVYERYEEKGIQYVVLGCGGAPLYQLAEDKIPGYQNSFEHTLGYARITIDGDTATMNVIKVADISEVNRNVTHIYPPNTIFETVVLSSSPAKQTFDTGVPVNPYPSNSGTHTGTIKPIYDVCVNNMYTYPCPGTGGHTESVQIENSSWCITANWTGYQGGGHNISFGDQFTLKARETYNYTIRTGSYPQIHHTDSLEVANGMAIITCDKFIDANGRVYYVGIPAIKFFC